MRDMPIIKLELQNMRFSIMSAMTKHNQEIEEIVSEQLKEVIETYPFAEVIAREARLILDQAIERTIRDYFNFGEGRDEIEKCVSEITGKSMRET